MFVSPIVIQNSQAVWRKTYRDCEVVTARKLGDLPSVPERSTHDDGLVSVLLVVVENVLHALDTRIFIRLVLLLGRSLVPVKNAANEGGNEESASLGSGNSLDLGEEKSQVAVDLVFALQLVGGLNALVG